MQFFFYILLIPFLYLNYKIIVSDLKYKIIPNIYLWYLLLLIPFYYIYLFLSFPDINYLLFIWQVFLTFIISFILYSLWIWAAWDAKYLLVLALFIPYIWIISFIWNIALITLIYLFIYFIWFYLGKNIFNNKYRKSLWWNIMHDLKEKWLIYKDNKWWKSIFILLKWLIVFLIIFVSIRLARIYLFNEIFIWETSRMQVIEWLFEKYHFYLLLLFIWFFIWLLYLFRIWINKLKTYIWTKLKLNINLVWNIFLIILSILLTWFIIIEYSNNPNEITKSLYLIFTLYISLWIIFRILIYSYKITFWIAEQDHINIKDLKKWEIVDKAFLIKIFWEQKVLWFNKKWEDNPNTKWILYPNPKKYFSQIPNPINKETLSFIKKIYKIVNNFHKENKTPWYIENNQIKILKTFSYWWYIFVWFIITYIFSNEIFIYFINNIIKILKELVS
jgi:Flp pilus assembly protein protease CpaA